MSLLAPAGAQPRATSLRLPELVVIGAMKAGTSALHRYLDDHPSIAMSGAKELNFFFGPDGAASADDGWHRGNWHRGLDWYAAQHDQTAPVRGEASPGYTSPSHPEAAARMAAVLPDARLIHLVRDPLERAISQYRHHRREGTENRSMADALLDPESQYVARSRYAERLTPFLAVFPRDQLLVVAQEELLHDRPATLAQVYSFVGVDPAHWSPALDLRWHTAEGAPEAPGAELARDFAAAVRDDAEELQDLAGHRFGRWSV